MKIKYKVNEIVSTEQFIDLLQRSSLGQRRPIEDVQCMKGMVENSNLLVSAWHEQKLVGVARSMTDLHYACYLSDLAVDMDYQQRGIGKQLQQLTRQQLGPRCKLILIAAPAANEYYRELGFTHNERCWILMADEPMSS
jgi:ribosomal protein S18 acetylase RimI-like enzyme